MGVLRLGLERRLPMVLHSLALRDVVTLWVESVSILVRSEGLAVFAGVSSSVNCHLSFFSRVDTGHVFLCSMFRHPSVGCITCECSSLPHSLLEGSVPRWSVQRLVAVPWIEPSSVYSHIAVQFPADSDVYFSDSVDMCGWLEFLFPTLLFTLSA